MKITEELKIGTTKELLAILVPALVTMLVTVWISIQDPLADIVLEKVPRSVLVLLPIVMLLLLALAGLYIFHLRRKLKPKLRIALGVYWDRELNPYCPSCQKLLGNYAFYPAGLKKGSPGFKCVSCKEIIRLSGDEKIFMTFDEARDYLKRTIN